MSAERQRQGGGRLATLRLEAPPEVRRIVRVLEDAGFNTWAVGGAVRDAISGGHPEDWDFATAARPGDVQRAFRRTVPVGIEHGTVGVLGRDGHLYEVTTFRRDVETFGRRARVAFSDRLEDDLERRDFTINAVAWHPLTCEIRDPHDGVADLRAGRLRTVGAPQLRFEEDRLRVLRALRFAGRFDLRVDAQTWAAIRSSADRLGHLSAERIREELYKVLDLARPSGALRLYESSGILRALYPELQACREVPSGGETDVWIHLLQTVDSVKKGHRTVRLAALLHDIGRPPTAPEHDGPDPRHAEIGGRMARDMMRRLKASNAETDRVAHLISQHSPLPPADAPDPVIRRWVRLVGPDFLNDLFRLRFADWRGRNGDERPERILDLWKRARQVRAEGAPLTIGQLAIGGAELRQLGIPAGPVYGEILRHLLERVTDDPSLNSREQLMELVQKQVQDPE